jgi:hypothetical protein
VESREELIIQPPPNLSGAEADPIAISLELVAETVSGCTNEGEGEPLADTECQICKSAQFFAGEGLGFIFSVLALDCPVLSVLGLSDEVDSFISVRQGQLRANRTGGFAKRPHVFQFRRVVGMKMEKAPTETFEAVSLGFSIEFG